jgi:hypothetical protein
MTLELTSMGASGLAGQYCLSRLQRAQAMPILMAGPVAP